MKDKKEILKDLMNNSNEILASEKFEDDLSVELAVNNLSENKDNLPVDIKKINELKERLKQAKKINDDYEYSTTYLRDILEEFRPVLKFAPALAQDLEHPRALEACGTFIKNLSDIASKLSEEHEKNIRIKKQLNGDKTDQSSPPPVAVQTNVNIDVADLQRIIKQDNAQK